MDSLTQALLGATTFGFVLDKEIGKKSLWIGAFAGTIPDLDVFLAPFFHKVAFLSIHRGFSHSMFLAVLLSVVLGSIFYRYYQKKQPPRKWMLAFFLALFTHSLLDVCTTFGTRLLSPFSNLLFSTNNIHVFEPIYTLILLGGIIYLGAKNHSKEKRQKILFVTLFLSILYLSWTFVSKSIAQQHFETDLQKQGIFYDRLMLSPTPLNSFLWHGIIKTEHGYYFGTYSLFDKRKWIHFYYEKSDNEIINMVNKNKLINTFLNYTQDFPLIRLDSMGNVNIFAVKYGPVNYLGKPEFIYPLSFYQNKLEDEFIKIDVPDKQIGPVKSFRELFKRMKGI
ncbi:MAG: metal-dependent hydrolase [Saprospiraceae bacterium]